KIAEGQWYRYAPSYVSPAYHLLEGFPFIQEPPSGDLQERVLIRHHDYDQCFQSVQLLQWNSQRSEERRVGKECRSRWGPQQLKKKEEQKRESARAKNMRSTGTRTPEPVTGRKRPPARENQAVTNTRRRVRACTQQSIDGTKTEHP